jgi:chemotaxis protein CheX
MQGELSTLISVFGDLSGTCSISFPKKLATKLISSMMMDDSIDDVNSDVIDGIGEITNLTAGGAKAELFKVLGTKASISTPTVIAGAKHSVNHRPDVPCIGCVFEAEGMRFALEVAVYPDK